MSKALRPAELRAFADEHLAYEIEMLFAAVRTRDGRLLSDDSSLLSLFYNARVEAFVSHLRTLIGFLFPDVYRRIVLCNRSNGPITINSGDWRETENGGRVIQSKAYFWPEGLGAGRLAASRNRGSFDRASSI
jgi:hypothetical protein